ncbi:MAG: hypothetical protein JNL51_17720 [Chitinophagaceae bacterium]|nr:hypothetical protein [Chitinophagaceae bacterium]
MEAEFPQISFVGLEGYNLKYGKNRLYTYLLLALQLPKILIKINKEKFWISRFLQENRVDLVISDNRFGFFSPKTPSVFITHQLAIQTGLGKWIDQIAQWVNYRWIKKFTECWIPDFEDGPNAAGILSHPSKLPPLPVRYIGCLSRFSDKKKKERRRSDNDTMDESNVREINNTAETAVLSPRSFAGNITAPGGIVKTSEGITKAPAPSSQSPASYDLLCILSGPEPQRSIFEQIIQKQLAAYPGKSALVRGVPGLSAETQATPASDSLNASFSNTHNPYFKDSSLPPPGSVRTSSSGDMGYSSSNPPGITVFPYASSDLLYQLISNASLVVSRSGYTTVMDMLSLRKKMILTPTPGQGEQEYLAARLQSNRLAITMKQEDFSIQRAVEQAEAFEFQYLDKDMGLYKKVIRKFLSDHGLIATIY